MITKSQTLENPNFSSLYVMKRTFTQILDTIRFEFTRNLKKTILMLGLYFVVFALIFAYNFSNRNFISDVPSTYIQGTYFLSGELISLLPLLLAIVFGSSLLVEDFQNTTGNLLFPNTTKFRLLIGRTLSSFVLGSISLFLFYFLIAFDVMFEYSSLTIVPMEFWYSLFWCLLYYFMLLSLTIFFSSFSRSTAIVIVLVVLLILVVSMIFRVFIVLTGYSQEPIFIITYFGDIINEILSYPQQRSRTSTLRFLDRFSKAGSSRTITTWYTPSPIEALIFMVGYSLVFLVLAYFIYERRQVQ